MITVYIDGENFRKNLSINRAVAAVAHETVAISAGKLQKYAV